MPTQPPPEKPRIATSPKQAADTKREELLREQAKTETEKRPYLDTEGGE
ncbi:MAG TPA: hypothetical protein VF403_08960 [Kofleriaceae bacterium]